MHLQRRHFVLSVLAVLSACAQAPSQRLGTSEHPIESVRVYAWGAGDAALGSAGAERFAQTLRRNGLPVVDFVGLDRALPDVAALERAWGSAPRAAGATHALVLTRQRLDTFGSASYIRYEAVLWNAASRKLVWQSTLASLSNLAGESSAQRAEKLAGDVLRGLARDGFVALSTPAPRDATGSDIPPTLVPVQIR